MSPTNHTAGDKAEGSQAAASAVPGMGRKAARGAVWMAAGKVLGSLLAMLKVLIVARLLGPDGPRELGVFAVAVLVIELSRVMSEIGLRHALIQRADDPAPYADTAWTAEVVRGLVLGALVFFAAPWLAAFFNKPAAEMPLRALAMAPVLVGFQNIWTFSFDRELKFHKKFAFQVGARATGLVVAAVYAWIRPSLWALVVGQLAGELAGVGLSYVLCRRFCRLEFRPRKFRPLFSFGFWIFVTAMLTIAMSRGGDFVIGKLLPAAALGIFTMAANLSSRVVAQISQVGAQTVFPVFSRLQGERERLRSGFLRTFFAMSAVVLFVAAGLISVGDEAVRILLGPDWLEAVPLVKILAVWGALRGLSPIMDVLFRGVGRPKWAAWCTGASLVLFAAGVYPMATAFGAVGVAWVLAGSQVIGHGIRYPLVARVLDLPARKMLLRLAVPVAAAAGSAAACHFVRAALADLAPILRLLCCVGILVALHVLVYMVADRLLPFRTLGALADVLRSYLPRRFMTGGPPADAGAAESEPQDRRRIPPCPM